MMRLNKSFLILILISLFIISTVNYQFEIPNYQPLKRLKILTQKNELNFNMDHFLGITNNKTKLTQNEQNIEGQKYNQNNLIFQMFIFPYRVYSYIDERNKRQYIFSRIEYDEFPTYQQSIKQQQHKINDKQTIITNSEQSYLKFNTSDEPNITFSRNILEYLKNKQFYNFLPSYLIINQQQHQDIQLKKINEQYFLIKNKAIPTSKHSPSYYENFDLYNIDFHSYIFVANNNRMKYFDAQSNRNNVRAYQTNTQKYQQFREKQQKSRDFNNNLEYKDNKNQMADFLVSLNNTILNKLFVNEMKVSVEDETLFSYAANDYSFYFVQTIKKQCPQQNKKGFFSLFTSAQTQTKVYKNCIHLLLHEKQFAQNKLKQSLQYITDHQVIENIKQLGTYFQQNQNLVIHILTENKQFQIRINEKQSQLISKDILQYSKSTIFLNNKKIDLFDNKVQIWQKKTNFNRLSLYFQSGCSIQIKPQALYHQKINNQLFVVCVQGSTCHIYNTYCNKVTSVQFDNAYGIQWNYRMNFMKNQVIAYLQASKRSDNIFKLIKIPVQQSDLQQISLKSGIQLLSLQFKQTKQFHYKIKRKLLQKSLQYLSKSHSLYLKTILTQKIKQSVYIRPSLFDYKFYYSLDVFQQKYFDYTLKKYLKHYYNQYYFPRYLGLIKNESINTDFSQLKIQDLENQQEFKQILNGCQYRKEEKKIIFKKDWNMCKVNIKPQSLIIIQSFENLYSEQKQTSSQREVNKQQIKSEDKSDQNYIISSSQIRKDYYDSQKIIMICQTDQKDIQPKKCNLHISQTNKLFEQLLRKMPYYLIRSKFYQIYFINKKKLLSGKNLLNLHQNYSKKYLKQNFYQFYNQIKHEGDFTNSTHNDIFLKDYELEQLENAAMLLNIGFFVTLTMLFFTFTIILCKTYLFNLLVYYDIIKIKPQHKYPLGSFALKIKMKQLKKKKLITISKEQSKNQTQICCFCINHINQKQQIVESYCKHKFHKQCFTDWIKIEKLPKCPLCKRKINLIGYKNFIKNTSKKLKITTLEVLQNFSLQNPQQAITVNSLTLEQLGEEQYERQIQISED